MRQIVIATVAATLAAFAASNRTLAFDQDQNSRNQTQSQSDSQHRDASNHDRQNSQAPDDEETEFRGMEHAALGVLLSERQGHGVRVRDVLPDGPAEEAGLQPGDRITKINGKTTKSYSDVIRQVNRLQPGQSVTIAVERNGQEKDVRARTASREQVYGHGQHFSGERGQYKDQGRNRDNWQNDRGQNQTASRRQQSRWSYRGQDEDRGVLGVDLDHERGAAVIRDVRPGSPAQEAGLRRGDEIVEVDGQHVRDSEDVMHDLQGREPGDRVTLVVYRNGHERNVQARLISAQELDQHDGDQQQNRDSRQTERQDNDRNQSQNDRRRADQQDNDQQRD